MPVTILVSAKSSGVTTSALALTLASKKRSLLAECDPAGGDLRAGYLQNTVHAGYGLYHLAAADRIGPEAMAGAFTSHLWPLDGDVGNRKLLPGLTASTQAGSMAGTWTSVSEILHVLAEQRGWDVYVDAGRLAFDSGRLHPALTPAPLLHNADLVLLVVQGTAASLALAKQVIEPLKAELDAHGTGGDALGLLVIEHGPYKAQNVTTELGLDVHAVLPWDPDTAEFFHTGGRPPRGFGRRGMLPHARTATERIDGAVQRRRYQHGQGAPAVNHQMAGVLQRLPNAPQGAQTHG